MAERLVGGIGRKCRVVLGAGLLLFVVSVRASWAALVATPVFVQFPQIAQFEMVAGLASQCTAQFQPFSCCSGPSSWTCTTTAASTVAAPVWVTVYTGGSTGPGSKIVALMAATTDSALSHLVTCVVNKNGVRVAGAAVTVPVSAGYAAATPVINLLGSGTWPGLPIDSDGNPYILLSSSSDSIQCRYTTGLTSATLIGITAIGGDF